MSQEDAQRGLAGERGAGSSRGGGPRKPRVPVWERERQRLAQTVARIESRVGGKVTALVPSSGDSSRATVRVDGRSTVTLQSNRIAELGIAEGVAWDAALASRVATAAEADRVQQRALMKLNRRAMSRGELSRKLRAEGFSVASTDDALGRLEAAGLIDDEAYGRSLLHALTLGKPAGPRLMAGRLRARGLDPALVDRLIAEVRPDADTQRAEAEALARKRLGSLERHDAATRQRRLMGLLMRRGFDGDIAREVVRAVLAGAGDDAAADPVLGD